MRRTNMQIDATVPFLKLPGGKRWLGPWLLEFIGELQALDGMPRR